MVGVWILAVVVSVIVLVGVFVWGKNSVKSRAPAQPVVPVVPQPPVDPLATWKEQLAVANNLMMAAQLRLDGARARHHAQAIDRTADEVEGVEGVVRGQPQAGVAQPVGAVSDAEARVRAEAQAEATRVAQAAQAAQAQAEARVRAQATQEKDRAVAQAQADATRARDQAVRDAVSQANRAKDREAMSLAALAKRLHGLSRGVTTHPEEQEMVRLLETSRQLAPRLAQMYETLFDESLAEMLGRELQHDDERARALAVLGAQPPAPQPPPQPAPAPQNP